MLPHPLRTSGPRARRAVPVTLALAAVLAAGALLAPLSLLDPAAAEAGPKLVDSDGDGAYSLADMRAVWPKMTPALFAKIDTNGDHKIEPEELKAAEASGLIMANDP